MILHVCAVISRFCKLFFFTCKKTKKEAKKSFLSSLTATTEKPIVFFFTGLFFLHILKLYESFSQESYFWKWTFEWKTWTDSRRFFHHSGCGKVSPRPSEIYDITWLATGSRMDSMVFVWKTGILMRATMEQLTKNSLQTICTNSILSRAFPSYLSTLQKNFEFTFALEFCLIKKKKIIKKLWTHYAK